MLNKFKKNDIVICISNIENDSCGIIFDTFMKLGTIKIVNKYDYGVEFEEFVELESDEDKHIILEFSTGARD